MTNPGLVVFDLDFTLWDCGGTWCDCLTPPFARCGSDVVDASSNHVQLYEDVPAILDLCDAQSIPCALASRTDRACRACQLLDLLDVRHRFSYEEIYPSSKLRHFQALELASGLPYERMLFFDDEMRNIREVSTLGVKCVYIEQGLTRQIFNQAID